MSSPLIEITVDGEMMSVRNHTMLFNLESHFKVGEEYDEKMPRQTLKVSKYELRISNGSSSLIDPHHMEITIFITIFIIYKIFLN